MNIVRHLQKKCVFHLKSLITLSAVLLLKKSILTSLDIEKLTTMTNSPPTSFFIAPIVEEEVCDAIKDLSNSSRTD